MFFSFIAFDFLEIFFCPVKWVALFALGKPGLSKGIDIQGNDSNLLIVFYVQIMPDDFVMQLHRF